MASKNTNIEHRIEDGFWFGILYQHLTFIDDCLKEDNEWRNRAIVLKTNARQALLSIKHNEKFEKSVAQNILKYKVEILSAKLKGEVVLNMQPTMLDHMIKENKQFIDILNNRGSSPNSIALHKLWIVDAFGHANAVYDGLDPGIECVKRKTLKKHLKALKSLEAKVIELYEYEKDIPIPDSILEDLLDESSNIITDFAEHLEMILKSTPQGIINPEMIVHFLREEYYYLYKISDTNEISPRLFLDPILNELIKEFESM